MLQNYNLKLFIIFQNYHKIIPISQNYFPFLLHKIIPQNFSKEISPHLFPKIIFHNYFLNLIILININYQHISPKYLIKIILYKILK